MRVISRVGEPCSGYRLEKQEWRAGEWIDGFKVPFNVYGTTRGLFGRFGLWQSSYGVCRAGKDHEPFWLGEYTMQTYAPVLVGDYVMGRQVLESECEYLDRFDVWECHVRYGQPQTATAVAQDVRLLQAYIDSDAGIADAVLGLMREMLIQVLPLCICGQGGLNTAPAMGALEMLQQQTRQRISQMLDQVRGQLWH